MEGASTPWRVPKPDQMAFASTGALTKKHKPTTLRMSLPTGATPETPLKKERSKFIAPTSITPFALSPHRLQRSYGVMAGAASKLSSSFNAGGPMEVEQELHLNTEDSIFECPTRCSSPMGAFLKPMGASASIDDLSEEPVNAPCPVNPFSQCSPAKPGPLAHEEGSDEFRLTVFPWKSGAVHRLDPDYFSESTNWLLRASRKELADQKFLDYLESKYVILDLIGKGSFSEVFKVRRLLDGCICALKKSRNPFTGMTNRLRRLQEVANMWLLTGNPHCVQIIESWEQNGYLYIIMEYCENGSLRDVIEYMAEADVRFTEYQIWQILHQISSGLRHLHCHDVIHLDLKPANIFIDEKGTLKIGDFGLSLRSGSDHDQDMEGDKYYMAPETLEGTYDKPADIFSLGLIILELAADVELPSQGSSWQNLRHGDYSELSFEDVSDALNSLIKEMMDPEPERRPRIDEVVHRAATFSARLQMEP